MDTMYQLIDLEKDEEIGIITEDQVQFLIDNLEVDGIEETDYYIDESTLNFFLDNGCDEELLAMLTDAMEGRTSLDLRYIPLNYVKKWDSARFG